jgi:hypothetical protein
LISKKIEVKVRIQGEEGDYFSRFVKIVPGPNGADFFKSSNEDPGLAMEKLVPERGNSIIRQFPEVVVEFSANRCLCRCHSKYARIDNRYSDSGLIMDFPAFMELEERRSEERITLGPREFISAVFELTKGSVQGQVYELDILNWSGHGLALLVTEKDLDLLGVLKPMDSIPKITLFAASALINFDATVRHMAAIEGGRYGGNYLLGLKLNTSIEKSIAEVPTA